MSNTKIKVKTKRTNSDNVTPLIQLRGSDSAPVINYNIPEPTTYTGRHVIELRLSQVDEENNKIFNKDAFTGIPLPSGQPPTITLDTVINAMNNGFSDEGMFPLVRSYAGLFRLVGDGSKEPYQIVSNQDLSTELRNLHPQEVYSSLLANKSLMVYRTIFGSLSYQYVEPIAGFVVPLAEIVDPGLPINTPGLTLQSPGDNAVLSGPIPRFKFTMTGTYHPNEPLGLEKIDVQVGSDPFVVASTVWSGNIYNWSVQIIVGSPGKKTVTIRAEQKGGEQEDILTATITTSFSNRIAGGIRPRLLLLESYRLESHLGQYGAGRIIKTFTLLPGEKTKISTRTYTRTETQAKRASSVLDSITEESTKDYENSISTEQSDKKNYQESFSYEINAKAQASWGWGSADVSGGVKGGTNSSHDEFAKNISNATQKHASTASSKREVQINTSYEEQHIEETEISMEREVQNINVSRTLNFIFRQMNQEHITALCLVDARVAVWDGNADPSSSVRMEVALSELHSLLTRFIVEEKQEEVERAITDQLSILFDYQDNEVTNFIEQKTILDRNGNPARTYWRVNPKLKTDYSPHINNNKFTVQGVLVKADPHIMRTDGVMVEALLGEGDALDKYSHGLQHESIRTKALENELKEMKIKKEQLGIDIVKDSKEKEVKLFEKVFPCCEPNIFSLWPPPKDKKTAEIEDGD